MDRRGHCGSALALAVIGSGACSDGARETVGRTESAVIGGAPADDRTTALVEVTRPSNSTIPVRTSRCTGRIVAPGLLLTARHCILKTAVEEFRCDADGAPEGTPPSLDFAEPDWMRIGIGTSLEALRYVAVRKLLAPPAISLCRADFAFVVLAEREDEHRSAFLRRALVVGNTFSVTGWGRQGNTDVLALTPSTLAALPVTMVGPGVIPIGTFTTRGRTLCPGDSGAIALVDGAVAGVFSRAESGDCESPDNRMFFGASFGYEDFIERAFAEVGETPRYVPDAPRTESDASVEAADATAFMPPQSEPQSGCATASHHRSRGDCWPLAVVSLLLTRRPRRRPSPHAADANTRSRRARLDPRR